jgi:hypothetical protein
MADDLLDGDAAAPPVERVGNAEAGLILLALATGIAAIFLVVLAFPTGDSLLSTELPDTLMFYGGLAAGVASAINWTGLLVYWAWKHERRRGAS